MQPYATRFLYMFADYNVISESNVSPGGQGPAQPNLSNVGHYGSTRLSTTSKQLPVLM